MSNKLPTKREVRLLIAEDLRQEVHGKVTLVGLMPGEQFLITGKPDANAPPNVAFAIASLGFLIVITGGEGKFKARVKVIAPGKKKTTMIDVSMDKPIEKIAGRTAIFGTSAKPFVGPAFGTYTVQVELDKAKFAFPMKIEQGPTDLPSA